MGCCSSNATKLPSNAQPLNENYPLISKILQNLQGEWELYKISQGEVRRTYHSTIVVTNNNYQAKNDPNIQTFEWFCDPNDQNKIFYDKFGSHIQNINNENGEITMCDWQLESIILWRRPDSVLTLSKYTKSKSMELDAKMLANVVSNITPVDETKELFPKQPDSTIIVVTQSICRDCGMKKNSGKMYDGSWYCNECYANYY
eukprot:441429_1